MQMKSDYMPFYLEGCQDPLDDDELDFEDLTEKALAGPDDVHTVVSKAVTAIAAPLEHDREKREWIADHTDEIKEAGGDGQEAYKHFLKGRTDETTRSIEAEIVELMHDDGEEDEAPDEDDDEDEDEDEDEEEEEDD